MPTLLGTVLASPVVTGNYDSDTYGTHFSFLGVGGWQELELTSERDAIPVDTLGNLDPTGLSSGRRRLGMLVYVAEVDTIYQLYIPYNAYTGLTSAAKVAALANNANWIEFTAGGGGDAIKKKIQQTTHNFSFGDVVSFDGASYVKGIASAGNTYEFLGIVSNVIDADNFVITYSGFIDLTSMPLSGNTVYFVSPSVAGAIQTTEPFNPGESSRPILITQESTKGLVIMMRSFIVADVGTSGNTGNGMRIQRTTVQSGHSFTIGDVITYSGGTYTKALAIKESNQLIGVVNEVFSPSTFIVCFDGYVDGFSGVLDEYGSGLTSSTLYYLSPNVPGKLTPIKPVANNQVVIPVYQSITIDDGIVKNQGGYLLRDTFGNEIFVVPDIAARDAKFVASGSTPGPGQIESFVGLLVFVIDYDTSGNSQTYIDATGLLGWSAVTNTVDIILDWNEIINKPNVITGATNIGDGTGLIVDTSVTGATLNLRTLKSGAAIGIITSGDTITIAVTGTTSGSTNVIGPAEGGGAYDDGIYTDFVASTPIGTPIDRFNKLFLLVLPQQPALLTSLNGTGAFVSGKLSWGVSRNDISYVNVGTNAGNAAVDINGSYTIGGTRLGIVRTTVTGILNSAVTGNITGIPFFDFAFQRGNEGKLVMQRNGVTVSTLILSGTTAATSNSRMSVSAVQFVKASGGAPITEFKYRTGTYTIPTSGMTNGYNYIRITHSGSSFSTQTNFLEFAYDPEATNISAASTGLTNLSMGGSKNISGVKYHTSGTVQYQGTISNAYKNVYSSSATAISFPSTVNLGSLTNLDVTGAGIINRITSTLQTLPDLNSAVSNPQNTNIAILATFPINSTVVLGNVGTTGMIRSGVAILHPFTAKQISGGLSTMIGFLLYNITQGNVLNSESYTGEVNRLQARDYSVLAYGDVNGGTYAWDSSLALNGVNPFYNTGMLVFNDELMYPNAAYLTTQYGITTGNFAAVTNSPGGNVNYTAVSGIRDHYRKFTSANGTTQATLTFTIDHTGSSGDFLTNGGTGGTAAGNSIKVEFLIMRSGGAIHGWANPFASSGNPEGIANTSTSQAGTVMTVTCTLSTTPRVATGDIVIVRTFHASGYTNRIRTLSVTNI